MSTKRQFKQINDDDIQEILESKESVNTKKQISKAVRAFKDFLNRCNVREDFENLEREEICDHLIKFFTGIRKGEDKYKTNTLVSFKYGISKYLAAKSDIDVKNDSSFVQFRQVFDALLTQNKKDGYGSTTHKDPIEEEDLQKLYSGTTPVFDIDAPVGLQNKVFFELMLYLCRRGRENLREMSKSTFKVGTDAQGREYIYQFQDELDKNHRSASDESGAGRMYETGTSKCPVKSFKKYISKLNPKLNALWQRPLNSFVDDEQVWYCNAPLGMKVIGQKMQEISTLAELSKRYTNHCIRATCITMLDSCGYEARHIKAISGHKSITSIEHYSSNVTINKRRKISDTLSTVLHGSTPDSSSTLALPSSITMPALPSSIVPMQLQSTATLAVSEPTPPGTSALTLPSSTTLAALPSSNTIPMPLQPLSSVSSNTLNTKQPAPLVPLQFEDTEDMGVFSITEEGDCWNMPTKTNDTVDSTETMPSNNNNTLSTTNVTLSPVFGGSSNVIKNFNFSNCNVNFYTK